MTNDEKKKEIDKVFDKSRRDMVQLAITVAEDDAKLARFIGKKTARLDSIRHDILDEMSEDGS